MKNFMNKTIIEARIDNLQSKRQTTIGMTKNVKRLTNSNLEQQKKDLIEKYKQLATIQENIGAKRSSRRKRKKRTQNKRKKRKIREKNAK